MKISVIQLPVFMGNRQHNLQQMENMLAKAVTSKPDVVVLPELWNTGFYPKPIKKFADLDGDGIKRTMSSLAAKYMVNIVAGSVPVNRNGDVYNTSYIFNRSGELTAAYDKVHLFSPAGENRDFTAGNKITVFTLDGVKCGMAICYDVRFPEYIRKIAMEGINVLFLPAAWPIERIMHWDTLTRARAIENQLFVVAANGISDPDEGDFHLGGHSAIIDPWGEILAQGSSDNLTGEIIEAKLRLGIQAQIRATIDVFQDRKKELY